MNDIKDFEQNVINKYQSAGEEWLKSLPELTTMLATKWHLQDLKLGNNLTFNYILHGRQGSQPIILKLAIDTDALAQEWAALQAFQGFGVIKTFDYDSVSKAMLIEEAIPGTTLAQINSPDDITSTKIACMMIDQLHQAPIPHNHKFVHLADLLQILDQNWPLPTAQINLARSLRKTLMVDTPVLLHGDLHYDNILANGDHWSVIDPKGVVGDPIYDNIGCLLREPLAKLLACNVVEVISKRAEFIASHTNIDLRRILDATYVHTVMAICWCFEDQQDPENMLHFLKYLDEVRGAIATYK